MLSLLLLEQGLLEEAARSLEARELAGQLGGQSRISWAHNRIAVCLELRDPLRRIPRARQAAHRHAVQSRTRPPVLSAPEQWRGRPDRTNLRHAGRTVAEANAMAEAAWPWASEAELPALFGRSYRHGDWPQPGRAAGACWARAA